MFRSSADRLRTWLTGAGDLLWGPYEPAEDDDDARSERSPADPEHESFDRDARAEDPPVDAPHPHRLPLRWERDRRPGSVPARPAHCISPVRRQPAARPLPYR